MDLNCSQGLSYNAGMTGEIELGDWLKNKRLSKNLSIREFGRLSKIPHTTIADIEKGIKPSVNVVKKLAAFLKVEESYLFVMAGIMEAQKVFSNAIANESEGLPKAVQEDILDYVKFKRKQYEEGRTKNDKTK